MKNVELKKEILDLLNQVKIKCDNAEMTPGKIHLEEQQKDFEAYVFLAKTAYSLEVILDEQAETDYETSYYESGC